jgi:hypothetical protein
MENMTETEDSVKIQSIQTQMLKLNKLENTKWNQICLKLLVNQLLEAHNEDSG